MQLSTSLEDSLQPPQEMCNVMSSVTHELVVQQHRIKKLEYILYYVSKIEELKARIRDLIVRDERYNMFTCLLLLYSC